MAVGSIPNTAGIGLAEAGVRLGRAGHVEVDRVSRTTVRGVYAAGDCTGVLPLASVAAMQGRIAMWHSLGDAVAAARPAQGLLERLHRPRRSPRSGCRTRTSRPAGCRGVVVKLPLATNARAKMQGVRDGFVKLVCAPGQRHGCSAVSWSRPGPAS